MQLTENEKKILDLKPETLQSFERMKTFIKRGNIEARHNWELKYNLEKVFYKIVEKMGDIGFLRTQNLIEPFMGNEVYEKMWEEAFFKCINQGKATNNRDFLSRVVSDEKLQNEKNITPRLVQIIKKIVLENPIDRIAQEKQIKQSAYEAALIKYEKSRAKNPKPVEPYELNNIGFDLLKNWATIFKEELFYLIDEKGLTNDVLNMKAKYEAGYYHHTLFYGNMAQVMMFEDFAIRTSAVRDFSQEAVNRRSVFEKFYESPGFKEIFDGAEVDFSPGLFRDFQQNYIIDDDVIEKAIKEKDFDFYRIKTKLSSVIHSFGVASIKRNGVDHLEHNSFEDYLNASISPQEFLSALNGIQEKIGSEDLKEYQKLYCFRLVYDEDYKETVLKGILPKGVEKVLENCNAILNENVEDMNEVLQLQAKVSKMHALDNAKSDSFYYQPENEADRELYDDSIMKNDRGETFEQVTRRLQEEKLEEFNKNSAIPVKVFKSLLNEQMDKNISSDINDTQDYQGFKL